MTNPDSTMPWVKKHTSTDGVVRPSLVLRMTTDSNYIYDQIGYVVGYNVPVHTKAMLNCGLPGQRIPGAVQWSVTENIESPTHTATAEFINALPVSQTQTTLTANLDKQVYSPTCRYHIVRNGYGVPMQLTGSIPIGFYTDPTTGGKYVEENLLYRIMANETVSVTSTSGFPDPRVPSDEADASAYWTTSATGSGAYYILIDDEIMRVHDYTGTTFEVAPGGRGVNGIIQAHTAGAAVKLLGFPPYAGGEWAGIGYLSAHDYRPYRSPLRPGTCFASYEGFGTFASGSLSKSSWTPGSDRGYAFTGYWFVTNQDSSVSVDGKATIQIELNSTGHILQQQKISPQALRRLKTSNDNWASAIFDQAGHTRNIPGDWVDFHKWNPWLPESYPLKLKTEYAQHKEFLEHMEGSGQGTKCPYCYQEWQDAVGKGGKYSQDEIALQRQVGRHVYAQSVRVFNQGNGVWDAGPLRTYGRLMLAMAKASWENQTVVEANPLAQRFTKMPNALWDNLNNWFSGRVWNGSLSFTFDGDKPDYFYKQKSEGYAFDDQTFDDRQVLQLKRSKLLCPFEASYDNQEWFTPIADLAELNRMTFQISRQGYPILVPLGFKLRGRSHLNSGVGTNGEWHQAWGGNINNYSHNLDSSGVLTHVTVTGKTAFESDFAITAAGTSYDLINSRLYWHSSRVGNKEALQMTGGIVQSDTLSLDQIVFGLDWDTNRASWGGVTLLREGEFESLAPMPSFPNTAAVLVYDPGPGLSSRGEYVEFVQKALNFFIKRRYISIPKDRNDNSYPLGLIIDGVFGSATEDAVKRLQNMLRNTQKPSGAYYLVGSVYEPGGVNYGKWTPHLNGVAKEWITNNAEYIATDIWWYALAQLPWEYYVAAMTGMPIPQRRAEESTNLAEDGWTIDQNQLLTNIEEWQKTFLRTAVMLGNHKVDESINKAAVRQINTTYADPRIELGDVIWLDIPGFLAPTDLLGNTRPPFEHGVYVTQVNRSMDLVAGTYTGTYSGYRYRGQFDDSFATHPDNFYQEYQ